MFILTILLTATSVRCMGSDSSLINWCQKNWSDFVITLSMPNQPPEQFSPEQLEAYNHNQPLVLFFYCFAQNIDQVCTLKESVKAFMRLSAVCKNFLTPERCGNFCKNYAWHEKHKILFNLYRGMDDMDELTYQSVRIPALILIYAGADANTMIGQSYLLTQAAFLGDVSMTEVLLKHDAHPDSGERAYPIFFFIRNIEILKLFSNYNANLKRTPQKVPTNVLWEVIRPFYPSELIKFYLAQGINPEQRHPLDNSCLLHALANSDEVDDTKNFMEKANLLVNALPIDLINSRDKRGQTPIDLAQASLESSTVPEAFRQLIALLSTCGDLSAKEIAR